MSAGSVFAELKRRNVLRVGALYAAAWLLAQVVTQIFTVFTIPAWTMRWLIAALIVGFPFASAFAWSCEFTPSGLKRESEVDLAESMTRHTGRKLDRGIIAVLLFAQLKRRNAIRRAGLLYLVGASLLSQVASTLMIGFIPALCSPGYSS
ncbi:MAG TPA: hypothetical protein VIM06_04530 [Rhodanobacter sp.]